MKSEYRSDLGRAVSPHPTDSDDRELEFITHPLAFLSDADRAELNAGLVEIARRRREVETEARLKRLV